MNWLSSLEIAIDALRTHALRTALTMLAVVLGVGALITMVAVGSGAQAVVEDQIAALGTHLITVVPGSRTAGGVRLGAGARTSLTEEDAYALQRDVPDVHGVAPTLRGAGHMVLESRNWTTSFHGTTPQFVEVRNWPIASGRNFNVAEMEGASKVVLLGETVVKKLFGDVDPIGQIVRVRKVPMEVIGILAPKGHTIQGDDYDDLIVIPITTARKRVLGGSYAKVGSVHYISVKIREDADMNIVKADIRGLLRERHRLRADQPDDFTIRNFWDVLGAHSQAAAIMARLLAAVAAVSLLAGGIGIMNIMLVSIAERTREIGLRMAVGARARDIRMQFLVEAMAITLAGGLTGIPLGIGTSYAIALFAGWPTVLAASPVLLAALSSVLIGVFFGLYPAYKASTLSPVEALRSE